MNKTYTIKQLKEVVETIKDTQTCPQEYIVKYNTISPKLNPGGRAWIMWFIDQLK